MTKNNKRSIIILTSITIVAISLVALVSYGLWQKNYTQKGVNENIFGCLDITYSENVSSIGLSNAYPMSISEGVETDPYVVTMTNKCDVISSYSIVMSKRSDSNPLDDKYVMVAVDGDIKKFSEAEKTENQSFSGFTTSISREISKGILGSKATRKISIRSWFDNGTDNSDNSQNKTFNYKISIKNVTTDKNTPNKLLAQTILEQGVKTGTIDFTKGEPPESGSSSTGSGLFSADDDNGTSYYFRGQAQNNYVNFAGQKWRIVRINGDGTIRLILDDKLGTSYDFNNSDNERKHVGYTYDNSACTNNSPCWSSHTSGSGTFINSHGGSNSSIKNTLEGWYRSTLSGNDSKIAYGTYCNDTSYGSGVDDDSSNTMYYGAYERLSSSGSNYGNPALKCPDPTDATGQMRTYGGVYKLKIGLLSADETSYAGLPNNENASSHNYLYKQYNWSGLSPSRFSYSFKGVYQAGGGKLLEYPVTSYSSVRPVINLTPDTLITTGNGSADTPYEVQ